VTASLRHCDASAGCPRRTERSRAGEVEPQEATPGAYESDDAERERGKQVKPGN
jgi:hypothetical protein